MNPGERLIGYDMIRIIAATMVVCIHSNVFFLERARNETEWLIIMLMTAICVVSVPLFFMVSGAGNLVKEEIISFKILFKKKIPKVFIPFVIWSLIYVVIRIAIGKIEFNPQAFLSLLWEPAYYQFWFMYALSGMYLCIPVFQWLIIRSDKKLLQYVILFWIISSLIFPMFVRYIPGFKLSSHFNLIFLEGYWGYFFLGGYLRKYSISKPVKKGAIIATVGTIITLVSALLEWKLTPTDRYYGYVYQSYLLPGAAMMTIGLFLILQHIKFTQIQKKVIVCLSGLTMGIFYIHCLLINIYEIVFKHISPTPLNAVIKLAVVLAMALVTCYGLKKIKPINRYLL